MRHQCATDFAGHKGAGLRIDRADLGPLGIVEDWHVDRTGQMVLAVLGRGADVDDGIDSQALQVSQRGEDQRGHGVPWYGALDLPLSNGLCYAT